MRIIGRHISDHFLFIWINLMIAKCTFFSLSEGVCVCVCARAGNFFRLDDWNEPTCWVENHVFPFGTTNNNEKNRRHVVRLIEVKQPSSKPKIFPFLLVHAPRYHIGLNFWSRRRRRPSNVDHPPKKKKNKRKISFVLGAHAGCIVGRVRRSAAGDTTAEHQHTRAKRWKRQKHTGDAAPYYTC